MSVRFFEDIIEAAFMPKDLIEFGKGLAFCCECKLFVGEYLVPLRRPWAVGDAFEEYTLCGEAVERCIDGAVGAVAELVK